MDALLELVDLIYDSVTDESRWQVFLDAFVQTVRAQGATLAIFGGPNVAAVACWSGCSAEDVEQYTASYAAGDPWRIRAGRQPEGTVATDFEFCPRGEA